MKTKELKDLTAEELRRKVGETRRELLLTRFQQANQQLKNPLKLRTLRRGIARMLTLLKEKSAPAAKEAK
jgi:large subunit ribosomal protein L29